MPWLEVETKAKIKNLPEIREKIKQIAKFYKKEKKTDQYFALKTGIYPRKAFRIRACSEGYVINFKKWLKQYWDKDIVVKEEFEFKIKNKQEIEHFLALLKDLFFKRWIEKIKITEAYKYKKDPRLIIEINYVKYLGYWIEIEYLCKSKASEVKKAKKKIREVLKLLNIKQKDIDNTGYTKMLYELRKKKRKK